MIISKPINTTFKRLPNDGFQLYCDTAVSAIEIEIYITGRIASFKDNALNEPEARKKSRY